MESSMPTRIRATCFSPTTDALRCSISEWSGTPQMKSFLATVPGRVNQLLDALSNSDVELRVKWSDAKMIVESIEKVANRIAAGIVLAALIIGAALLMRVETTYRIFGYPGIAMLFFLAACAGGFWLVVSTFIRDHKARRKTRR